MLTQKQPTGLEERQQATHRTGKSLLEISALARTSGSYDAPAWAELNDIYQVTLKELGRRPEGRANSLADGCRSTTLTFRVNDDASDDAFDGLSGVPRNVVVSDDDVPQVFVRVPALASTLVSENSTFNIEVTRNTVSGPLTVQLNTDDVSLLGLPDSITIPEGRLTVTVPVTVSDDVMNQVDRFATITASADSHASSSLTFTVKDDEPSVMRFELRANGVPHAFDLLDVQSDHNIRGQRGPDDCVPG